MKRQTIALLAALGIVGLCQAQESVLENQAPRCSALSFVLGGGDGPNNQAFASAMADMSEFFSFMYANSRQMRTGTKVTRGEANERRDSVLKELAKTWPSNPEAVRREMALCSDWQTSIAEIISSSGSTVSVQQLEALPYPLPPKQPSAKALGKWQSLTDTAFAYWQSVDYVTPVSVRKQIEQSLASREKPAAATKSLLPLELMADFRRAVKNNDSKVIDLLGPALLRQLDTARTYAVIGGDKSAETEIEAVMRSVNMTLKQRALR